MTYVDLEDDALCDTPVLPPAPILPTASAIMARQPKEQWTHGAFWREEVGAPFKMCRWTWVLAALGVSGFLDLTLDQLIREAIRHTGWSEAQVLNLALLNDGAIDGFGESLRYARLVDDGREEAYAPPSDDAVREPSLLDELILPPRRVLQR